MVLLFTLGIFSIYSFFIVWQSISPRMATGLYAGPGGPGYRGRRSSAQPVLSSGIPSASSRWCSRCSAARRVPMQGPKVLRVGGKRESEKPDGELVPALQRSALPSSAGPATGDGVSVERIAVRGARGAGGRFRAKPAKLFTRFEGSQFGLDEPYSFSVLRVRGTVRCSSGVSPPAMFTTTAGRTSCSPRTRGLSLYANRQGRFVAQRIDIPALEGLLRRQRRAGRPEQRWLARHRVLHLPARDVRDLQPQGPVHQRRTSIGCPPRRRP